MLIAHLLVRLVLDNLTALPPERKCFRMINGVLVERTVKEVLPALRTNSEGLKKVLDELLRQYKRQQEEMDVWKVTSPLAVFIVAPDRSARSTRVCGLLTLLAPSEKEQYPGCPTMNDHSTEAKEHIYYLHLHVEIADF